jgi:hypothetical protein
MPVLVWVRERAFKLTMKGVLMSHSRLAKTTGCRKRQLVISTQNLNFALFERHFTPMVTVAPPTSSKKKNKGNAPSDASAATQSTGCSTNTGNPKQDMDKNLAPTKLDDTQKPKSNGGQSTISTSSSDNNNMHSSLEQHLLSRSRPLPLP